MGEDPADPKFEACHEDEGYTHDVQCVLYNGPDSKYVGREICFACNEGSYPQLGTSTVTIIDVTDKSNIFTISTTTYPTAVYTHQGWLTEDHKYFIFDDEVDEIRGTVNKYIYQANYKAGLNVLLPTDISKAEFEEVGYFDILPEDDTKGTTAMWSNYPYFPSGIVGASGTGQGLFLLDVTSVPKEAKVEDEAVSMDLFSYFGV